MKRNLKPIDSAVDTGQGSKTKFVYVVIDIASNGLKIKLTY